MTDVGGIRPGKVFLLFRYLAQALFLRFRHGIEAFYYVPAPVKPSALLRDWIVLPLARLFFKKIILHWEAGGLGTWCDTPPVTWARLLTRWCVQRADLSIALNEYSRQECNRLAPRLSIIVPNGIPDPCPDFETTVLPLRLRRFHKRQLHPAPYAIRNPPSTISHFRILYLAHCTRSKGLFDALESVFRLPESCPACLTIAGAFMSAEEQHEFETRRRAHPPHISVMVAGFVSGEEKNRLLRESDCLIFPSTYPAEVQPVSVVEALAWGLPPVVYQWRGVGELLQGTGLTPVPVGQIDRLTQALQECACYSDFDRCRRVFLQHYHVDAFLKGMTQALGEVAKK
jgi:glycosyltransferase involved in cell wall biosynthesis